MDDKLIDKFNKIQLEILDIGWRGILEKYHPDINLSHLEAFKLFLLYKEIYENMQKRVIITLIDGKEL